MDVIEKAKELCLRGGFTYHKDKVLKSLHEVEWKRNTKISYITFGHIKDHKAKGREWNGTEKRTLLSCRWH